MSTTQVGAALALPPDQLGPALLFLVDEDQWFDRKGPRVSLQALADLEIGFANAEGGTIVIGLSDRGVEGTDRYAAHRNELMKSAIRLTQPPVRTRSELKTCILDGGHLDHLLVIEVEPSEVVHANRRDEVFLRVGDENRKLTYRQRQELLFDKGQAVFEATTVPGASLQDLDQQELERYAAAAGHPDPGRLLLARSLITSRGEVSTAAILLFGKHPQASFPEAYVRILRYRGTDRGAGRRQQLVGDVRCEGAIPGQLIRAAREIEAVEPVRTALGEHGRFGRMGLIPKDAWLEGLVNAVVHRSYSLAGDHIRVEVFDDRIEIESPGRFPGLVNPKDPLKVTRFARNSRIARVCSDLDFGQELGEGIRRMFDEMRLAGLADPLYRQTEASVRLTLLATPLDRELEQRLPRDSRELLGVLRETGGMSTGDLADALGLSRPATLVRLAALREVGLVEWVGRRPKDPRAYWKLAR
ncbi:MAG: ATP-binding protein [Actinomycetota bacterium]